MNQQATGSVGRRGKVNQCKCREHVHCILLVKTTLNISMRREDGDIYLFYVNHEINSDDSHYCDVICDYEM